MCIYLYYSDTVVQWSSELKAITVKPFTETAGLKVPIPSAIGMFFLFFTSSLMDYIVNQTDQFALECMGGEKFAKWTQVTVKELQAYMGFMILMGLVKLPSIYDYWQRDEIYHYSPVASRITRDRFFELHRFLHFADNSTLAPPGTPEYNKLGKVQPIIDSLTKSFQSIYTPNRDLSVDEAMIPFKVRSTPKQYMPQKPVKRGIKVWALADAINGFVSMFQVYTGKQGNTVQKGLGANVVTTLTKPYVNTFRHVYFDNFFYQC